MNIKKKKAEKPRVRVHRSWTLGLVWVCVGRDRVGAGATPSHAYFNWYALNHAAEHG